MLKVDANLARRTLLLQLAVTTVFGIVAALFEPRLGWLAALGGFTATAGNWLVSLGVFGRYRAADPGGLAMRMFAAEVGRLLLVAAVLIAAMRGVESFDGMSLAALLGTLVVVHLVPAVYVMVRGT